MSNVISMVREWLALEYARLRESTLARHVGWLLLGQGTNVVIQAMYFIVLGRLLGSSQYGIYIGAFALTSLVSMFSAMGSGTLFLHHVSIDHSKFRLYWGNILMISTAGGALLIFATAWAGPHILNASSAALVPMTAVANCFCGELNANVARVFQAVGRMKTCAGLNSTVSLIRLLTAFGMLLSLHRASAFQWALAMMFVSLLSALLSLSTVTILYGWPAFSLRLMMQGIPEGLGYSFGQSAGTAYNEIDKSMLSHYGMNEANGIYALAYRVIDMATIPIIAVRDAAVPRFFRMGETDAQGARQLAFRLIKRCVALSLFFAVGMYVTAPLIPWAVGKSFAESVFAVRWLCLIPVLRSVHHTAGSAILGIGKYKYRLMNQVLTAVFNFSCNLWLIPAYGWRGAAWASLLADGALAILNLVFLLILTRPAGPNSPSVELQTVDRA